MKNTIRRITGDGMLLAMYIVLSIITVKITPNLQITFTAITVILACVLYGYPDSIMIALLGAFVAQLRSPYGLTITTPLWMIPPVLRALVFGLVYEIFLKRKVHLEDKKVLFVAFASLAGLMTTLANTGAIYLDAKIIGYPVSLAIIESIFRFVSSILTSIFCSIVSLPVIFALKNAGLYHDRIKDNSLENRSENV